jgi:hypothetical protein
MIEPVYNSFGEFAEVYKFTRQELNGYIQHGVVKPRRKPHGAVEMSETDMVRIAQYNTAQREKKTRLTGR